MIVADLMMRKRFYIGFLALRTYDLVAAANSLGTREVQYPFLIVATQVSVYSL